MLAVVFDQCWFWFVMICLVGGLFAWFVGRITDRREWRRDRRCGRMAPNELEELF